MSMDALLERALAHGFTHAAKMDVGTITLRDEVRDMCNANKCGLLGRCWTCPPACGDLASCEARIRGYRRGMIAQVVGQLEDAFDMEGMQAASEKHKQLMLSFAGELRGEYPRLLPLGSGGCIICEDCTCPTEPCRFPELAFSSMEAFGMLVTDACEKNGLPYYYGPNTIAYTGCFLID